MRFMLLVIPKGYEKAAPGTLPDDPKLVERMAKYNESLTKAGVLLGLDGLHPPSMGARVTFSGGKPKVTERVRSSSGRHPSRGTRASAHCCWSAPPRAHARRHFRGGTNG